jgi:uncharacterized membrane protein HdeD (DUF308 family)
MLSFILMQLIEYFIWKNIDKPTLNSFFSVLASCLLVMQPMASIMLLPPNIRIKVMIPYLLLAIPFFIYRYNTKPQFSSVSKLKHLHWNTILYNDEPIPIVIWLSFFLLPLLYRGSVLGFLFSSLTMLIMVYYYYRDRTFGTMWCWIVNIVMIYFAFYLLFYLPFYK